MAMTQPFPLACPCGQMLLVDPVDCGSLLRCPTCSGIVVVPDGPPDESIVIDTSRGTKRPPRPPATTTPSVPGYMPPQFRCPYCQTTAPPREESGISQAGWVMFVVLLLFCFPLCFIGLLMKDTTRRCSACGVRLG